MQRPVANGGGRRRRWLTRTLSVVPAAVLFAACSSTLPQSSLNPKSVEARQIDDLWILVLVLATIVFVIVEAALVFAIFRFRKRKNDDREPKQIHGNTPLEIVWSIIPASSSYVYFMRFILPTVKRGIISTGCYRDKGKPHGQHLL